MATRSGPARRVTIGELASHSGSSTKTIRYYESIGLLPAVPRTESGYRLYGPAELARLRFIAKAKQLGLSLAEARAILRIRDGGTSPCEHALGILDRHVEQVDRTIEQLGSFRRQLGELRADARRRVREQGPGVCGIVESAPITLHVPVEIAAPLRRRDKH